MLSTSINIDCTIDLVINTPLHYKTLIWLEDHDLSMRDHCGGLPFILSNKAQMLQSYLAAGKAPIG